MKQVLGLLGIFFTVFVVTIAIHAKILDFVNFGYDPFATYQTRCYFVGMIFAHVALSLVATISLLALHIDINGDL